MPINTKAGSCKAACALHNCIWITSARDTHKWEKKKKKAVLNVEKLYFAFFILAKGKCYSFYLITGISSVLPFFFLAAPPA